MKIKPVFVGIALLGFLLLVLSFSTVTKILAANPDAVLTGVKTQPFAPQLLPKRSPSFVSVLVNPEKLGLFAQLAAKPSDRGDVRHELENLKQQLRQNWLLEYDRDVKPWLDSEITLAMTDFDLDRISDNGLQAGYLLALSAKDVKIAKQTVDTFWQRLAVSGSDLGFEQYLGASILNTNPSASLNDNPIASIAGTTIGKFVLFANDVRVLRRAIDALQAPSLALANLDSYRDRLAKLDTGRVGVAYVNLAEFGEELPKESILISLGLDKDGIRAESILSKELSPEYLINAQSSNLKSSYLNSSIKSNSNIATAIPIGSSAIFGRDLNQTWQNLKDYLSPVSQRYIVQAIAASLGSIDTPVDVNPLALLHDDYAIAFAPNRDLKIDSNSDWLPEWLFVAKVEDAKSTETAIAALDSLAKYKLSVGKISLNNQPVTIWSKLSAIANKSNYAVSGELVAAHAETPNYIYLSNSLNFLESAIALKDSQSIASSKDFKTIVKKLPSDRQTYGYFDKNFNQKLLKGNLPDLLSNNAQKLGNSTLEFTLKYLEIISFSINPADADTQNLELVLHFK